MRRTTGDTRIRGVSNLTMRALTRVQVAILIVLVVLVVGAGAYFAQTPGNVAMQPSVPNPDSIVIESVSQPEVLDPSLAIDTAAASVIQNIYEQLVFFKGDKTDQVVTWLASSYEISNDGLTYTFHLRSGIKFTDGTPVDANAVYFSIMRTLVKDDPNSLAWAMFQVIRGGMNYSKSYNNAGPSAPNGYGDKYTQAELTDFINAKPVEVIDPMTVAFHLESPYSGFPTLLTTFDGSIISPTAYKAHWTAPTDGTPYLDGITAGDYADEANPWAISNAVGTGPYKLESWDKSTQVVVLVRNEEYWGGPYGRGVAPVKNVIIKGVDDPNTKILDFKGGQADIIGIPATINSQLPGGLIYQFADKSTWLSQHKLVPTSPDYQLFPADGLWPELNLNALGFIQEIKSSDGSVHAFQPFADARIRQAFILAFNRTAYLHDVLQDFGEPASQILPPGILGYDPTIQPTPYDLATAKQLLLDAGANPIKPENAFSPASPKTVELEYILGKSDYEAAMTILATDINNLASDTGLYANVVGIANRQYWPLLYHQQLQVFIAGWYVDYPDPDDFLVSYASINGGFYAIPMQYNNPKANELVRQESSTTDQDQRATIIKQIESIVNQDAVYLFLNYGVSFSISRSWIHERTNASVASGIAHYNPVVQGYYLSEIQKGPGSTGQIILPIAQLQLPAALTVVSSRRPT
jgi:peptide/nickel transport system substrate-binding protein